MNANGVNPAINNVVNSLMGQTALAGLDAPTPLSTPAPGTFAPGTTNNAGVSQDQPPATAPISQPAAPAATPAATQPQQPTMQMVAPMSGMSAYDPTGLGMGTKQGWLYNPAGPSQGPSNRSDTWVMPQGGTVPPGWQILSGNI